MKKILIIFGILVISIVTTVLSFYYQKDYKGVIGNMCGSVETNFIGYCYEDLPSGGFPFQYLFDRGGITEIGRLEIWDTFYVGWFTLDIVFYFVVFSLFGSLLKKFLQSQHGNMKKNTNS